MIDFTKGNIFDGNHQVLVNPVNCAGKMGRGLAKEFKKRFPHMFNLYKEYCDSDQLQPGKIHKVLENGKQWIINFPTKDHWRNPSKMEYIVSGLAALLKVIREMKFTDIGIPPLGCGLGGLHWYLVRAEIKKAFINFKVDWKLKITVYEA